MTPSLSIHARGWRRRHALTGSRRAFLLMCGLAVATGVVVLMEPAPYDLAVLVLLGAAILLRRFVVAREHYGPAILLAVFFAANALSLANAVDVKTGVRYAAVSAYLAVSSLFFVGVAGFHGERGVRVLLNGYVAAAWFSAAVAALAFFHFIPFQDVLLLYGRAKGLFKDPNVFGPYLVPALLAGLAALQRAKGAVRIVGAIAGCGLTVLGVFLSFSRAAWLNCAISAIAFAGLQFLFGIRMRRVPARLLWPLGAVPVMVAVVVFAASQAQLGRLLDDRLGDNGFHKYDDDRFATQQRGLQKVLQQPLGIGPGQSEAVFEYSTHSMYVRVLTENGPLGFTAFYALVLWGWLRATRLALSCGPLDRFSRDVFVIVSASLLGLLINGLVIDTIHWRHLWFLLGLAWWAPRPLSAERVRA